MSHVDVWQSDQWVPESQDSEQRCFGGIAGSSPRVGQSVNEHAERGSEGWGLEEVITRWTLDCDFPFVERDWAVSSGLLYQ